MAWFEEHYCRADLRWLGFFRVVLGSVLIGQLLNCWGVARDFYTNDGILPNHFSLFRPLGRGVVSLYHAFSTLPEVNVAFAITLAIFLTFTLGYRTRLFHALSFICITSLDARNLMVENGGTVVINLLTFWALFLPLGKRLSVDALIASLRDRAEQGSADLNRRQRTPEAAQAFYSLAIFALLFQWSAIYFFNAVHKSGEGWRNGSAIHWFLYQNRIVTWFGIYAREHAPFWLLQGFTYATLVVEWSLSVLLLLPFRQLWLRRIAFLFALGLHGGIAASARLGPFSYVMVSFFFLTLSAADWNWLRLRLAKPRAPLTVIYDADCGICLQICRILQRWDVFERLRFVGNDERSEIPDDLTPELLDETVVTLTPDGKRYFRERAAAEILSALPLAGLGSGWLLRIPGLSWLARLGYVAVSRRRHALSAQLGLGQCGVRAPAGARVSEEPAPPAVPRVWPDVLTSTSVAVREALVILALVMTVNQLRTDNDWARAHLEHGSQPPALLAFVDTFRLYQGWRMFAPEPPYEDGRLVVDARTVDGRKLDPLTGEAPDFNPETDVGWGQNQFWCDYHLKMFFPRYAGYRQLLREYLERYHQRTQRPQDRLLAFDVWWVNVKSPAPGAAHGDPQKPVKIVSLGEVKDSGALPWLRGDIPRSEP
ncbi:MAG TPA: DCC1-like thiol-disulfide oxidoreductase family protein [Polyangiaceae bacterium]|nr:DCC1-like thiol-disulfide oxidoreductase family protein [Polyangiaceae bacterium]